MRHAFIAAAVLPSGLLAAQRPAPAPAEDKLGDLVQTYLWPASDAEFRAAEGALNADASLKSRPASGFTTSRKRCGAAAGRIRRRRGASTAATR